MAPRIHPRRQRSSVLFSVGAVCTLLPLLLKRVPDGAKSALTISQPVVESTDGGEGAVAEVENGDGQSESQEDMRQSLPTISEMHAAVPITESIKAFVNRSREAIAAVLQGKDDRLVVVVGPCSIHDLRAARHYAQKLKRSASTHRADLLMVMRTYLEKPRTTVGWKGLITDPELSGEDNLKDGLSAGRTVLLEMNAAGLPTGVEFLDPLVTPYLSDLVSYGSIGARTTESPVHRSLAASLDKIPIGFKNTRSGDVESAVNAVLAASKPQRYLALDWDGLGMVAATASGNPNAHVVLRGAESGPNYDAAHVNRTIELLETAGFTGRRVVVDCSHGNSGKVHQGQIPACKAVSQQIAAGVGGIGGVMIESFLKAGNQKFVPGVTRPNGLSYGQSITDACIDFGATKALLADLAAASRSRRAKLS